MSIEQLKTNVRMLQGELAKNGMNLRLAKNIERQAELLHARLEIYKSIAHLQGRMIEVLRAENKFMVAA